VRKEDILAKNDQPKPKFVMFSPDLHRTEKVRLSHDRDDNSIDFDPSIQNTENLATLNSAEDPVAFFAKNKDGPVKFVYLNRVKEEKSLNPYRLKMVSPSELDKDYYTMSSNGVTFVRSDGQSGTRVFFLIQI
jgi:hypothetical protein